MRCNFAVARFCRRSGRRKASLYIHSKNAAPAPCRSGGTGWKDPFCDRTESTGAEKQGCGGAAAPAGGRADPKKRKRMCPRMGSGPPPSSGKAAALGGVAVPRLYRGAQKKRRARIFQSIHERRTHPAKNHLLFLCTKNFRGSIMILAKCGFNRCVWRPVLRMQGAGCWSTPFLLCTFLCLNLDYSRFCRRSKIFSQNFTNFLPDAKRHPHLRRTLIVFLSLLF